MAAPLLPLADDYWLAAHDTVKGTSRLSPRTLGIGVGSALLAELMFAGNVTLSQGRLFITWDCPPPNDPALTPVLNQLVEEEQRQAEMSRSDGRGHRAGRHDPGQDVREWIAYLATDDRAADLVARRLSQSGHVEIGVRRTWTGKRVETYVPRDANTAGWPGSRISTATQRGLYLGPQDLVLAGLFLATGLHQHSLSQLESRDFRELGEQLRTRMHDMLRELVSHAETAVGEAVMTR
jgi:hypothetical protein